MNVTKLSIITVTYNCLADFKTTAESIRQQEDPRIEWIVVDGGSKDGTKEAIEQNPLVSKWVSESDKGIYDAMNKGLRMATGEGIIFMNAGDAFVGKMTEKVTRAPGFLPVETMRLGRFRTRLKVKSVRQGLPYCHQGIVFENKGLEYDLQYKIAADYDFYIRHGYDSKLAFYDVPHNTHVYYDNRGFSISRFRQRDDEIEGIIRKNFGLPSAWQFRLKVLLKNFIRTKIFNT